jgi:hypothetical protein
MDGRIAVDRENRKIAERRRRQHRAAVKKLLAVVKKDEDWDYGYLFLLLQCKLRNMLSYFEGDPYWDKCDPNFGKSVEALRKACALCDRIAEDDYAPEIPASLMPPFEGAAWDSYVKECGDSDKKKDADIKELFSTMAEYAQWWWD